MFTLQSYWKTMSQHKIWNVSYYGGNKISLYNPRSYYNEFGATKTFRKDIVLPVDLEDSGLLSQLTKIRVKIK